MRLSFNLLKQYVDLDNINYLEVADRLTYAGIEVENAYKLCEATDLVIGKIISCSNHPNSDHLHILQVDFGPNYGINQIVCGAPNAREGLKVIVARVGAHLPNDITITKSTIRGIESNGMCCSLNELGVDHKFLTDKQISGIEELDDDAVVGDEEVLKYLGLDDYILEINVLANRPDLLGVYNIAKEVGALFKRKVKELKFDYNNLEKSSFKVGSTSDKCKQFSIKEIINIKSNKSPKWLKSYLEASNIRSINALVDIGNFIMLVTGQPLHMYDLDKLDKKELIVEDDFDGDFIALDDKTYHINKNDLVVTSNNKVMCLGGVMGSKYCEVDGSTKNVAIEAASFYHANIRHTSQRLGLVSESSLRFVKGTNHFQYDFVLDYTAYLIDTICGFDKQYQSITYIDEKYEPNIINTSVNYINNRLGSNFNKEEIIEVLSCLNFKVEEKDNNLKIIVPSFRLDVNNQADIAEEVIRYLGFDKIDSKLPNLDQSVGHYSFILENNKKISDYLTNQGLLEVLTYTLISKKQSEVFDYLYKGETYKILNPLTDIHQYIRKSIMPSLIECSLYNLNHQNKDFMIYEISNIQTKEDNGISLGIVLSGKRQIQGLLKQSDVNFYTLKGLIESIMSLFNISKGRYNIIKNNNVDLLHPLQSALITIENKVVGYFGLLHPSYLKEIGLDNNKLFVLEIRLEKLYDLKTSLNKFKAISKYPSVERDLAFIIKKDVASEDIVKLIKGCNKNLIRDVYVFDVYEDDKLLNNNKSIALKIIYQSYDETLKEDLINSTQNKIIESVIKKFNAALRN